MKLAEIVRRLLPYTTAAAIIAILYVGWVFFSRSHQNRELEQKAETQQIENTEKTIDLAGGESLKILNFYLNPEVVPRGTKGRLCYGVANAKSVKLDPSFEPIWPSLGRCIEISPTGETTYTLTATDAQGHNATASVVARVR